MERNFYAQSPLEARKSGAKLFCEDHPGEKITNFDFTTLKPLCPSCIDPHNKMLRQNETFPEVDTLKNVKTNCSKKVKNAIAALTSELTRLDSHVVPNPRDAIESGIINMNKARERVIQMVHKYFDELEAEHTRRVNEIMVKLNNGGGDVTDKIKTLISELDHLLINIESPLCIQSIKKILMIDIKAMLDKLRTEVNSALDNRNYLITSFSDVIFDEQRLYHMNETLSKVVYLNEREEKPIDQNPYGRNYAQEVEKFKAQTQMQATQIPPAALFKYHRTYFNNTDVKFPITMPDYFEPSSQAKYLHFFQNHENKINYLELDKLFQGGYPKFQTIDLDIKFDLPPFHKSIAIPSGDIYLIGGSDPENYKKKLKSTFLFDFKRNTLIQRANMIIPRSSFAVCYMNKYIYTIGGLTNNSIFTSACEKYDISGDRWIPIAPVNFDVLAPCVASFNNRYLYKFGGNSLENRFDTFIERYDSSTNIWSPIAFTLDNSCGNPQYFRSLTTSACIQINQQEIYVFGGYLDESTGSNQTFLLHVDDENNMSGIPVHIITGFGVKSLRDPEAFWNNVPLIYNKQIIALQNIPTPEHEDICLDDSRRIIIFNGIEWKNFNQKKLDMESNLSNFFFGAFL